MSLKDLFKSRENLINEGVATSYTALGTANQEENDKYFLRTYYESLPSKSAIIQDIRMVEDEVADGWCEICGCIATCEHTR